MLRFLLYPEDLQDLCKYESGTKIADLKNEKGFGFLMIRKRPNFLLLEFVWMPNKGRSRNINCTKDISKMSKKEFEKYITTTFEKLINDLS